MGRTMLDLESILEVLHGGREERTIKFLLNLPKLNERQWQVLHYLQLLKKLPK